MEENKVRPPIAGAASRLVHATADGPGAGSAGLHFAAALESDVEAASRLDMPASMLLLSEIRQVVDTEVAKYGARTNHGSLEHLRRNIAAAIDATLAQKASRHVSILKAIRDSFLAMPHVRAVVYQPIDKDAWKVAIVHNNKDDYAEMYKITDKIIEVERALDGFAMDPRILTMDYVERGGLGDWGTVIFDRRYEAIGDQKRK